MIAGAIDIELLRTAKVECSSEILNERWRQVKAQALQLSAPALAEAAGILTTIIGISFPEPGYTCVQFAPNPTDLLWMSGELTVPDGKIALDFRREPSQNVVTVTAPTGTHIKPVLPCSATDQLYVDGEPVHPDSIQLRSPNAAELAVLPGSTYLFRIVRHL